MPNARARPLTTRAEMINLRIRRPQKIESCPVLVGAFGFLAFRTTASAAVHSCIAAWPSSRLPLQMQGGLLFIDPTNLALLIIWAPIVCMADQGW